MGNVTLKVLDDTDLKRPSQVQFRKWMGPAIAGPCDPAVHPVVASFADDFARANGAGFQSGNWREVLTDLPFNPGDPNNSWPSIATVHLNGGNLQAFRNTIDGGMAVAGIYQAAPLALNWYVEATLGPTAMLGPASIGGGMVIALLLAQTVPADPAPTLAGLTFNGLYMTCERHFPNPTTEWEFHLGLGSTQSNLITPYVAPANTFVPGSTFGLRVVCNGTSRRPNYEGFVNGAMVFQLVPSDGTINLPAGRPGCGVFGQELAYPFNTQNVVYDSLASWRADQLA